MSSCCHTVDTSIGFSSFPVCCMGNLLGCHENDSAFLASPVSCQAIIINFRISYRRFNWFSAYRTAELLSGFASHCCSFMYRIQLVHQSLLRTKPDGSMGTPDLATVCRPDEHRAICSSISGICILALCAHRPVRIQDSLILLRVLLFLTVGAEPIVRAKPILWISLTRR